MPRPILATIHQAALRANLARLARAAPDARVWAIVKGNAYGHGIERVFDALRGADGFALLDLAEAERVRALGWRGPILLLEGAFEPRDLEHCSRLGLWHVVHHAQQIDWLAAHKAQAPQRVFLKLNSGMNRLGFAPEAFRGAWARLSALPQVEDVALMTHFSDADGPRLGRDGVAHQVDCFARLTQDLPGERSLCNSAAALLHARAGLSADWIRPGIAVYGSAPDFPTHSAAQLELQPTMSLRTRLIATQTLRAGDTVGYGSAFQAERDMRIGIAACGYADGYPRHAPGGAQLSTPALLEGVRTRLVGRISMDMLAVDLEPAQQQGLQPDVGSEVVLWGRSALGPVLPVDEVAHAAGTVAYELLCALAPRVPVLVDDADN